MVIFCAASLISCLPHCLPAGLLSPPIYGYKLHAWVLVLPHYHSDFRISVSQAHMCGDRFCTVFGSNTSTATTAKLRLASFGQEPPACERPDVSSGEKIQSDKVHCHMPVRVTAKEIASADTSATQARTSIYLTAGSAGRHPGSPTRCPRRLARHPPRWGPYGTRRP